MHRQDPYSAEDLMLTCVPYPGVLKEVNLASSSCQGKAQTYSQDTGLSY